jgi:hypothetical protein
MCAKSSVVEGVREEGAKKGGSECQESRQVCGKEVRRRKICCFEWVVAAATALHRRLHTPRAALKNAKSTESSSFFVFPDFNIRFLAPADQFDKPNLGVQQGTLLVGRNLARARTDKTNLCALPHSKIASEPDRNRRQSKACFLSDFFIVLFYSLLAQNNSGY